MIDPLGNLINGMFFALGTVIISTIAIYVGFKKGSKLIKDIISKIIEVWTEVKEGLIIEGKLKTKKKK